MKKMPNTTKTYSKFFSSFILSSLLFCGAAQAKDVVVQGLDVVDMPMGQSSSGGDLLLPEDDTNSWLDDDLFGLEGGGYLHAYLTIGGEYTDNLFNVNVDEKNNFLTTINPGIWMSLPSRKDIPLAIAPNNTSPGGLQASLEDFTSFDRMNLYLLGGITYKMYSEDSDLNDYDARLEGLFKYNLRGGFSIEFIDRFTRGQDRFDVGSSTANNVRRYLSNIAMANANWDITEKVRTKLTYSNFYLDYKDREDEFLSRTDNSLALFGYYNYSVKTSLFLEYRYVDVAYDLSVNRDSDNQYIFGGFNWLTTDKTSLRFKLGYQYKDYKNDAVNDAIKNSSDASNDGLALEFALDYQFTQKSKFIFTLNHSIEETDTFNSLDKRVLAGDIRYEQDFSEKFLGLCTLRYENSDYTMIEGAARDEDRYFIRPALQYLFQDWLMAELSYSYDTRHSSQDYYDYDTNTISLRINSAL